MYYYQHGLHILQSVQYLGYCMENQQIVITFTVVEKNVLSPSKHSDWFWGWASFLLNGLSLVIQLPLYEVNHRPPANAEMKNAWNYTSTPW